jgi:hypothetical protein
MSSGLHESFSDPTPADCALERESIEPYNLTIAACSFAKKPPKIREPF